MANTKAYESITWTEDGDGHKNDANVQRYQVVVGIKNRNWVLHKHACIQLAAQNGCEAELGQQCVFSPHPQAERL